VPRFVFSLLVFSSFASMNAAERVPPAVEVRVRAAADMLDVFDYLIKLVPNDEQYQQYLKMAKTFGESKTGFLGLDPKKPIGAYVGIADDVADSPVVLMVPVAVEADFLSLLKTLLKLDPKKLEGGLYSFVIPKIPAGPGYFRIAHGYAYITIRSAKSIDADRLLPPKEFFAEEQAGILNAKIRIDRFPADIRKAILGQIELDWHETFDTKTACPYCAFARKTMIDWAAATVKTLSNDGESFDFALNIEPNRGAAIRWKLLPRKGSPTAHYFQNAGLGDVWAVELKADDKALARMLTGKK